MNKLQFEEYQLIKCLFKEKYINQRNLSEKLDLSLGKVNSCLKHLIQLEYLTESYTLTSKAYEFIEQNKPKRAVLLAAGVGLRMIPINHNIPKALLTIKNEVLIERMIEHLHEVGVHEIYVVVGFMKENFDYLIDKYNVKLIVNRYYFDKNNLYSLYKARKHLENCYIVPCDLYFDENPFQDLELESWYLMSDKPSRHSNVTINKKHEIVKSNSTNYRMVGLSYINAQDCSKIQQLLEEYSSNEQYDKSFWEEILIDKNKMMIYAKLMNHQNVTEINTFEELRNLDESSSSLGHQTLDIISASLNIPVNEISNISCLKKGMTNRSFMFDVKDDRYIMRIPGEGTEQLINRKEEGDVYKAIADLHLSDDLVYFNSENGYKITKFLKNARVCDLDNIDDLTKSMRTLRKFHHSNVKVNHFFDIFEKIEFYESLRNTKSLYRDYDETKRKVIKLKDIVDALPKNYSLTHIDAVPDNFLFYEENGKEEIRLIDWEYASMQDTDVDIAMFCIYAMYEREQVERLIDIYYENECPNEIRLKIYCYIAMCGFLWSNWCEYKYTLGVEFGEYSIAQYRYAKDYYKIALNFKEENGL